MPGFGDTAVIALIALLLFGPKKLPVLARQLGKLMAEFRRASNEFRSQMEEELRIAEQTDRQKEVAALEAASANKISPPSEPDATPHTPPPAPNFASPEESDRVADTHTEFASADDMRYTETSAVTDTPVSEAYTGASSEPGENNVTAMPIATSGDLNMMPPETGLPVARSNSAASSNDSPPVEATPPATHTSTHDAELEPETLHG